MALHAYWIRKKCAKGANNRELVRQEDDTAFQIRGANREFGHGFPIFSGGDSLRSPEGILEGSDEGVVVEGFIKVGGEADPESLFT